jgi:hypothetical protein
MMMEMIPAPTCLRLATFRMVVAAAAVSSWALLDWIFHAFQSRKASPVPKKCQKSLHHHLGVFCLHHFVIQVCVGSSVFAKVVLLWHSANVCKFSSSGCVSALCTTLQPRFVAFCICKFFTLLVFCSVYKVFLFFASFLSSGCMSAPLCNPGFWLFVFANFALFWHSAMFTKSFFFLHISSHLCIYLHHFVIQVCGFFVLASFALFLHSAQFEQSLNFFWQLFSHIVVCLHHFVIQVSGIFVFANFALFWHPAVFTKSYCALQIFPHPVYVCTTL